MKPNSFILLLIVAIVIVSCSEEGKETYKEFDETVEVVTKQRQFDSIYMRYPYRVRLHDSLLYILDLHTRDYYCHIFEYPSMRHVKSFARRGRAPNEMTICVGIEVSNDGLVYLLNSFGKKILIYDPNNERIKNVDLPRETIYYHDFVIYNDTTFIVPDSNGKNRFFRVNTKGEISHQTGSIPKNDYTGNVPESALGYAWNAFIGYNPSNQVVALATLLGEVIEIYHPSHVEPIIKVGPGGEPKCRFNGSKAHPDGIMGYSDIYVGKQYIYAIYCGYRIDEVMRKKITYDGGNFVHVFDFEGNPVKRYILDKYITGIFVNEATGEVFGTDMNETQLVTFHL